MAFLQVDYKSRQMGRKVHFNMFLPADVDPSGKTGAPWRTLYLLHGIYGNSTSWVTSSCVQRYADERNLCVVMPDGENGFYLDHPDYMNNFSSWIGQELVQITRRMFSGGSRAKIMVGTALSRRRQAAVESMTFRCSARMRS